MPTPNYNEELDEFLARKGAAHIAFRVVTEGASFSDLEEDTGLSPSTLSKRLKHGEYLGLWMTAAVRGQEGGRSKQQYVPTERGQELLGLMTSTGFARALVTHQAHKEEYEERKRELVETVHEQRNKGELAPPWEEATEPGPEALESVHGLDRNPDPDIDPEAINALSDIDLAKLSADDMRSILRDLAKNDSNNVAFEELLDESSGESND